MSDPLYHDKLLSHYYTPLNYGVLPDYDLAVREANLLCGDSLVMYMKMAGDRISTISFEHKGCVISRAAASLLTEYIKGKSQREVFCLTSSFVISNLLGVSLMPSRIRCASLALEAVQAAFREHAVV